MGSALKEAIAMMPICFLKGWQKISKMRKNSANDAACLLNSYADESGNPAFARFAGPRLPPR